ncbi:MAG: hypothetical protein AAGC49_14260 [Brevundimonas sp.]
MHEVLGAGAERRRPDPTRRSTATGARLAAAPERALALQRAVGNAAFARVVQRQPEILFPKSGQRILPPHYGVRTRPDADTNNVRVNVDTSGPQFEQAHQADGSWWFDWSGFAVGPHKLKAEAWNAAGVRTESSEVKVVAVNHAPVDPATVVVGAPVYTNRLTVTVTYTVGGLVRTADLHVSFGRHLVSEYFDAADAVYQPELTTLVDTDRATFAAAFLQYAQLMSQALTNQGLPLTPSNPEFELVTPSGIAFHSDAPVFGTQIHCFPTNRGGGMTRTFAPPAYADFKNLTRLCAYLYEAPAGRLTSTAIKRAAASVPFLAANPWLLARIQARYPAVVDYDGVIAAANAALAAQNAAKAAAAKAAAAAKKTAVIV